MKKSTIYYNYMNRKPIEISIMITIIILNINYLPVSFNDPGSRLKKKTS